MVDLFNLKMDVSALPKPTCNLLKQLKNKNFIKSFYLTGGTALSLHLGHRESEDLDFFSQKPFQLAFLLTQLEKISQPKGVETAPGTLNLFLNEVQLQFLYYPYQLLKPTINWQGIKVSSLIDIACTKLQTISARGNKKDFVDLYFLLKKHSLKTLFKKMAEKYRGVEHNQTFILKSLVYFIDAEKQPMPRMHIKIVWSEVKKEIIKKVKAFEL